MYRIVPRTEFGLPATVTNSNGTPRPPLHGERYMTAHYTGNNVDYTGKVTVEVVRQIQQVFQPSKPFEYNYVIGQEDNLEIYEFAGKFQAAHSGGENHEAFGVLFLLGVGEDPTDRMIDKWKWLRDVLIFDGALRPDVDQRMHFQMPGAATVCPGNVRNFWPLFLGPWVDPRPVPVPVPDGGEDMEAIFYPTFDPGLPGVKYWSDADPHLAQWSSGRLTRASNAHYDLAKLKAVPVLPLNSKDQYLDMVSQIGR